MSAPFFDPSRATMADLAAAREAYERPRREADERAAADRRRAAAEAEQAAQDACEAEVAVLIRPVMGPVVAAQQALDAARGRAQAARAAAERAHQVIADARAVVPAMVDRAVAGEAVSADQVASAHAAVARAEQHASFCLTVAGRYAALVPPAETALKAAITEAHRPVYERGVDLRIQAGAMADAARTEVDQIGDRAAMDAAHAVFVRGNRLLHIALAKGVLAARDGGISTAWPTRERVERRVWKRPAPGGEE